MITALGLVLGFGALWFGVKFLGTRWAEREILKMREQSDRCPHGILAYWADRRCATCRNQLEMDFNQEEYWRRRIQ